MEQLLRTIVAKQAEIDAIIVKAAPEWPMEKIALIDRNVLRLGLCELLYGDRNDVPPKVAINEAIELGKEFGGESSGRFVNGVLGAVYRDIGEPQKEEGGKRTAEEKELPTEELVGAVVYAQGTKEHELYIALVHDVFGYWTLSKGKLNQGEDVQSATLRKVQEELGLVGEIREPLGENEYIAHDPGVGRRRRKATYFLVETPFADIHLKQGGGLDDARWFRIVEIGALKFYDDLIPVITRAVSTLASKA
jgi:ADP-ribose pyrophosphatase YjhB (NUDIX family)